MKLITTDANVDKSANSDELRPAKKYKHGGDTETTLTSSSTLLVADNSLRAESLIYHENWRGIQIRSDSSEEVKKLIVGLNEIPNELLERFTTPAYLQKKVESIGGNVQIKGEAEFKYDNTVLTIDLFIDKRATEFHVSFEEKWRVLFDKQLLKMESLLIAASDNVYSYSDLRVTTWEEWSKQRDLVKFEFKTDSTVIENRERVRRSLTDTSKVTRVVAASGLGKTRLVLEALRPADKATEVRQTKCYYVNVNYGSDITSLIRMFQRRHFDGVLVIDDCSKELHNDICQKILTISDKFKVITIGQDVYTEEKTSEILITIEKSSNEVIRNIVKQIEGINDNSDDELSDEDISKIVKFSDGFPKVAELIANAYLTTSDLRNIDKSRTLEKILWSNTASDTKAYEVVRAFALFTEVGSQGAYKNQYEFVCEKIGRTQKFDGYGLAKRHFRQRGVFIEYGRFITVAPLPLAIKLATEWWEERHVDEAEEIFDELVKAKFNFKGSDNSLIKNFFTRLADLEFLPTVKEFTERVVQKYILESGVAEDKLGLEILRCLIPVNSEIVFSVVDNFFSDPQKRETLNPVFRFQQFTQQSLKIALEGDTIQQRNLPYSDAILPFSPVHASGLIGLLEKLAEKERTFLKAVKFLFRLALDPDDSIAMIAKPKFLSLFKIIAETEVAPVKRLETLVSLNDKSFDKNEEAFQMLMIDALSIALPQQQYTVIHSSSVGSARPTKFWEPPILEKKEIMEEDSKTITTVTFDNTPINEYIRKVLQWHLKYCALNTSMGHYARKQLATNMRTLLDRGYVYYLLEGIQEIARTITFWCDGLKAIVEAFFYYKLWENHSVEYLAQIKQLALLLQPRNQIDYIHFYVTSELYIFVHALDEFDKRTPQMLWDFSMLMEFIEKYGVKNLWSDPNKKLLTLMAKSIPKFSTSAENSKLLEILVAWDLFQVPSGGLFVKNTFRSSPSQLYPLIDSLIDFIKDKPEDIDSYLKQIRTYISAKKKVFYLTLRFMEKLSLVHPTKMRQFLDDLISNEHYSYIPALFATIGPTDNDVDKMFALIDSGRLDADALEVFAHHSCSISSMSNDKYQAILTRLLQWDNNLTFQSRLELLKKYKSSHREGHEFITKCISELLLSYQVTHYPSSMNLDEWEGKCLEQLWNDEEFPPKVIAKIYDFVQSKQCRFDQLQRLVTQLIQTHQNAAWETFKVLLVDASNYLSINSGIVMLGYSIGRRDWILDAVSYDNMSKWCQEYPAVPILLASRINLLNCDPHNSTHTWKKITLYLIENFWSDELSNRISANIGSSWVVGFDTEMLNNKKRLFEELRKLNKLEVTEWANRQLRSLEPSINTAHAEVEEHTHRYGSSRNSIENEISNISSNKRKTVPSPTFTSQSDSQQTDTEEIPSLLSHKKLKLVSSGNSFESTSQNVNELLAHRLHQAISRWGRCEQEDIDEAIQRSIADQQQKALAYSNLTTNANQFGFRCHNVAPDGNCFFNAVEDQLKRVSTGEHQIITAQQLREKAVGHILDHFDLYKESIDGDANIFIGKIMKGGEWADHIIILALSRALNMTFVIIRSDAAKPTIVRGKDSVRTIYLGYEVDWHYQSLIRDESITSNQNISELVQLAEIDNLNLNLPLSLETVPFTNTSTGNILNNSSSTTFTKQISPVREEGFFKTDSTIKFPTQEEIQQNYVLALSKAEYVGTDDHSNIEGDSELYFFRRGIYRE